MQEVAYILSYLSLVNIHWLADIQLVMQEGLDCSYLLWFLSVKVCPITVELGNCFFQRMPTSDPRCPGPTMSRVPFCKSAVAFVETKRCPYIVAL